MNITINHTSVEVLEGETILEAARRVGYDIPSMCYAKGAKHKSSCMVCAVKASGQIIPSCTAYPAEGMQIETDSEEVRLVRLLSLELLLSDHRADCEAPCSAVCPQGLDIEKMLGYYDGGQYERAYALIATAFALPVTGCDTCKAPCEKACRRGSIDRAVSIRRIIRELAEQFNAQAPTHSASSVGTDKGKYQSRLGRFSAKEKEQLIKSVTTSSECLHCACAGRAKCRLRPYATAAGIKRPRYGASSALQAMSKMHVGGSIWFEQAKCIRCGLCVYNSNNGFTFKGRGFGMEVTLPEENRANIGEGLAGICPTGAIYLLREANSESL